MTGTVRQTAPFCDGTFASSSGKRSVPTPAPAEEGERDNQEIHGKWASAADESLRVDLCRRPGASLSASAERGGPISPALNAIRGGKRAVEVRLK